MGGRHGLPSGIVTLLLTDVVGSTLGWQRSADAMDVALIRHTGLVEAAVTGHGGTMLKHRGEGDSTFSVFSRASDAVRAALEAQRRLVAESRPSGVRLSVRIALHSGEAIERDGDYFGPAVNRAARLRTLGSGGDVLLSGTTADLAADDLPADARLIDLGARLLRDLDRAERVFGLIAEGIRAPVVAADVSTPSWLEAHGVTVREAEVLAAVGERLTNAEIASRLYVSARTVETQIASLLRKLGAANRRQLAEFLKNSASAEPVRTEQRPPTLPPMLELLADASTFVGRRSERESLRRRWEVARVGHTMLVLVTGEAGMGKSRLVAELAAEVHTGGGRVLLGSCHEDADQPYGPFAEAISAEAVDLTEAELRRRVLECGVVLTRLSRELARAAPDGEARNAGGDVEVSERAVMLDAIVGWLVASASTAPTLLVVEDLHWSSPTTRDLMRHLVRTAGRPPLLVVATTRDNAPDLHEDLKILLGDLERSPAVARIRLHGLDRDEIAALAKVSGADAEAIVADTAGNPLLVTHMTGRVNDGSLAALLSRRDKLLDVKTRDILDLAATFGSEFEADLLAGGSGTPLLSVLDALEEAEAAGWVVPLPGRPGRFGFVHALFRSHRYRQLSLRRRLELHDQAAAALTTWPGRSEALSERARHACLAVPVGDARFAVDLSGEAGQEAEHAYAFDEAVAHYRWGLEAARSLAPPDRRSTLDLTVRLAAALHALRDPQGLSMLLDAAQRARQEGDNAALVHTAMSFSKFGRSRESGQPVPEIVAIIEDAMAVVGEHPSATKARLLIERPTPSASCESASSSSSPDRPKQWPAKSATTTPSPTCSSSPDTSSTIQAASRTTSASASNSNSSGVDYPASS
jgi:class 3 adenylate cyclase/DNA-binding CsgD family transcriptional regulator